jgi:hypothetical protein
MTSSIIQRSFAAGELGPPLYGRADQTKYQTGLRTCRNFLVMRHGGVTNRTGSKFIAEVKDSGTRTYLTKFVFNDEQTYVIEMGDLYFRFYREGAQLLSGGSPYEIVTPYAAADLALLKFVQSGDIITITHPGYAPRELARTGHTAWTLTAITFAPTITAPGAPAITTMGPGTTTWRYVVTAVKAETYEESVASVAGTNIGDPAAAATPHTMTWAAVAGAAEYNVYMESPADSGTYGLVGVATNAAFTNAGITPDTSITPPITRNPFAGAGDFPGTATYYQQRRMFAASTNNPETVHGSRTGMPKNFGISSPLQDDDAVTFTMKGRKVNEVRHMIEVDNLVILSSGGEWIVEGDSDGVLRANQPPNLKQRSYNGASDVMPVIVGNTIVYVQARGTILRDFRQDLIKGSESKDLSIYSPHLFEGFTIDRMDYAQIPHSIVWCVRSDGYLLGLTYLREHELAGWHRHDTTGVYEDVVCVPEGEEDAVYVIVRRTVGGVPRRYVERFASRRVTDVGVDALFLDSFLTYDGRNTTATMMTVTSTTGGWTHDDELIVTASGAYFAAGDVGNVMIVRLGDAETRIQIASFTSNIIVRGFPERDVPVAVRSLATLDWSKAVDSVSGLSHLEGLTVGILADGNVLSATTVSGGAIANLGRCYEVIHVGLPYDCDFETLDLDADGQQVRDSKKNVTSVSLLVEKSRGGGIGPDATRLSEVKTETPIGDPLALVSGVVEVNIASTWRQSGRFFVRQSDPLPLTILSAIPSGTVGG